MKMATKIYIFPLGLRIFAYLAYLICVGVLFFIEYQIAALVIAVLGPFFIWFSLWVPKIYINENNEVVFKLFSPQLLSHSEAVYSGGEYKYIVPMSELSGITVALREKGLYFYAVYKTGVRAEMRLRFCLSFTEILFSRGVEARISKIDNYVKANNKK